MSASSLYIKKSFILNQSVYSAALTALERMTLSDDNLVCAVIANMCH